MVTVVEVGVDVEVGTASMVMRVIVRSVLENAEETIFRCVHHLKKPRNNWKTKEEDR
jgi:hypothetical protein